MHDSREIRAMGQQNGIDIFGGNSLGVADAWNQVRIGGALGGDNPAEALRKGSIAIFSNSGNFTTTIATYLRMAGWGTTTLISSGKDVYIHYAAPEFAFALANDARSKAAVLYAEPGGYYELDAGFTKPVVACVVGRWKSKLTRAVGHAGAMAGGNDDAVAKEQWFMAKFGVDDIFTPENPVFSPRGAVVANIAHIPAALTAVMQANAARPDFEPEGSLALKPWFGSTRGWRSRRSSTSRWSRRRTPTTADRAAQPADRGGVSAPGHEGRLRRLADGSEDPDHGPARHLDAGRGAVPGRVEHLPVAPARAGRANDRALVNAAVGAEINLFGTPALAAAQAAREGGNAPNTVLAAACSILGPRMGSRRGGPCACWWSGFAAAGMTSAVDESFDLSLVGFDGADGDLFVSEAPDRKAEALLQGLEARGARSVFVRYLRSLNGYPTADAVLAAVAATLAWGSADAPSASRGSPSRPCPGGCGCSGVADRRVGRGRPAPGRHLLRHPQRGDPRLALAAEVAFAALLGTEPAPDALFAFQTLVGLLLSNGPGTISAQGRQGRGVGRRARDARAGAAQQGADRLPDPFRLTRTAATATRASPSCSSSSTAPIWKIPPTRITASTSALARRYAAEYASYKADRKTAGSLDIRKIPGVNHPGVQGQAGEPRPARGLRAELFARPRRVQRLPRLLPRARAGAVRGRGVAQRLLRQHRCGDRGAAPEDAVAALSGRAP